MSPARGLCRWIGHRFEARFERVEIPGLANRMGKIQVQAAQFVTDWWGASRFIPAQLAADHVTRRAYVRDVCVRCGATVERGDMGIPISERDQAVTGDGTSGSNGGDCPGGAAREVGTCVAPSAPVVGSGQSGACIMQAPFAWSWQREGERK